MRVALIAPPFISVPPKDYGGTELFVAHLALGLKQLGIEVIVYSNGESTADVERRWIYPHGQWPIKGEVFDSLKDLNHTAWAVRDAQNCCDVIHLNNAPGLVASRFVDQPFIYTIHHPHEKGLSEFYGYYPEVDYVTISDFQRLRETMPKVRTIHHGIDTSLYEVKKDKQPYLCFIGRIAPVKGTHLAIAIAKKSGIPLKIAGEIQPMFRDYYDGEVAPHVDGRFIQYVGYADLAAKNELLSNALALVFPIQWDEPFGLIMIESMACGTPVLAMPGGSVSEIIKEGVSGYVRSSVDELAELARRLGDECDPGATRAYVDTNFSLRRMVQEYSELYLEALERHATRAADDPKSETAFGVTLPSVA